MSSLSHCSYVTHQVYTHNFRSFFLFLGALLRTYIDECVSGPFFLSLSISSQWLIYIISGRVREYKAIRRPPAPAHIQMFLFTKKFVWFFFVGSRNVRYVRPEPRKADLCRLCVCLQREEYRQSNAFFNAPGEFSPTHTHIWTQPGSLSFSKWRPSLLSWFLATLDAREASLTPHTHIGSNLTFMCL